MEKLRPVEDVWDELSEVDTTDEVALGIIQAERDAVVQRCADAVHEEAYTDSTDYTVVSASVARRVILAVAKPRETERERLARKLFEADMVQNIGHTPGLHVPWEKILEDKRTKWRNFAAVAIIELDKIKEE